MSIRNIVDAVLAGDTVAATAELTTEMNKRRDDLIEQGRQFIAANVQESATQTSEE